MMKVLFTTISIYAALLCSLARAHDLKDGVVERDVQVVIFPDRVEFQYTIEMNARTRDKYLDEMRSKHLLESKDTRSSSADRKPVAKWDQFRNQVAPHLAKNLRLTVAGEDLPLSVLGTETIEKHSIKLYFVFSRKYRVPSSSVSLRIQDDNFSEHDGYHRLALKGRRGVAIVNSTVPPIVSSLPRKTWSKLSKKEKSAATTARADFSLESTD